jgi:hypothetical protein
MSIVHAATSGFHPGQPRRLLFLGSLLALGPVSLWAQSKTLVEVPPPGTAEEAVELTPFYVNEEESGYRATSTLAGTRLKDRSQGHRRGRLGGNQRDDERLWAR